MLKNIRLHIEKDDDKQKLLDEKLAASILECQKNNLNSFTRNIPSLMPLIRSSELQNHSIFCNKFGEINIVDYGLGRTLYGFHPKDEIQKQIQSFNQHAPYFPFSAEHTKSTIQDTCENATDLLASQGYINYSSFGPAPNEIECLVVLGCGLGLHLVDLMQNKTIKYLIIYEPQAQYFKCSTLVTEWNTIFELAKAKGTQLFLQVEKDGRDLVSDLEELKTHTNIEGFYLYKHYNHSVFNSLYQELTAKPWKTLKEQGVSFTLDENYNQYVPVWMPPIDLQNNKDISQNSALFAKNLSALEKYFPDIYKKFKNYQVKTWIPIENQDGEINVIKKDSLNTWYGEHPKADCDANFDNFNEQPNKDGLILGYSGTKLAHYIHFQFVKETEELLAQAENETGALPDNVASIIMFGIGVGYQIEKLLAEHTVEKLFLCEPNTDFFYASLHAIDWQVIFEKIDQSDARIYLNIGDDGTNLFRDLLSQFYSIGPYILSNTYFYQSYYNASLNKAISQLREQLQVVISMGEYFDHAYYGIAHTKEGMRRETPVLSAKPADKLSYTDKEVPIFIVGNGPSLDSSIEAIKEWQGQAIVVSCGTALQALHRHGITPDFHAEIEQNRSTFDWAVLIGDLDYLKNITLLSCNGIHPDTCDLYKDVLVAFKEGESSTVSALNVLGRENYEVLQNAFPTVSNFVCDLISRLGFTTIYLLGVDLGFVNVKHHHSKSSGYYQEDGQETYDYSEKNNTSLVVPGNFRPTVNTKHEFKVSRQVIEQVTAAKPKDQTFYNCSDGAKINGVLPIRPDNLLIVSTKEQKHQTLKLLKTVVFSSKGLDNYLQKFEKMFSQDLLMAELGAFEKLLENEITSKEDVENIINKQKEMLFSSYQKGNSLLFYYLYGTVNYANAVFSKLIYAADNLVTASEMVNQAKEKWLNYMTKIKQVLASNGFDDFDLSSFSLIKREKKILQNNCENCSILIVTDSPIFGEIINFILTNEFSWLKNKNIINPQQFHASLEIPDYAIYSIENPKFPKITGKKNTVIVVKPEQKVPIKYDGVTYLKSILNAEKSIINCPISLARIAILACLSEDNCNVIFPKYNALQSINLKNKFFKEPNLEYVSFNNSLYISLFFKKNNQQSRKIKNNGTRINKIVSPLIVKNLILTLMSETELFVHQQKITNFVNARAQEGKLKL
ncbi:6-hydroxymethylpterin diphosphokinase MptE-like protein [Paraglaciecola sp. L3A3]|uniref:6-hydroxymethylpterin diphosphokinase MptE-like protein n=1 Tax=Paraglaciecola sp. L3A3 TaxID=2686358 RepID=UPI00131BA583|nr:6-hydroxymethylpterin diphosphokinase MptE-like protein [Paraglaciecola sp. L3A3]